MTPRRLAAVLTALAFGIASHAHAWPMLNWNSCQWLDGSPLRTFTCDSNSGATFDLIYSTDVFTSMPDVTGARIRLWIQTAEGVLPAWWQLQAGGCRSGAMTFDAAAPFPSGCADPWLGAATVGATATFLDCNPKGLKLDLHAFLPEGVTRSLVTGPRYAMFRMRIDRSRTVGAGACGGCHLAACIGVQGISIENSTGAAWSIASDTYVRWQGTTSPCGNGPNCGPAPARASTWGSIKSLYR